VRVTEDTQFRNEMAGLNFREGYILVEEYSIQTTTYQIDNTTSEDKVVTIEAPINPGADLYETRDPDAKTTTERRWRVETTAGEITPFVRTERHLIFRHEDVRRLDYRRLQQFLKERWLDQATYDQLAAILDSLGAIQRARAEKQQLEAERKTIYERQDQLRQNLNALKGTGEEGQLRNRMLRQLESTEDRLQEMEERATALDQEIQQAEARIEELMDALGLKPKP
jgi:hypothetical protein